MIANKNKIVVNGKSYNVVGVVGRAGRHGYLLKNNNSKQYEYFPAYYPNVQNSPTSVFNIKKFNKVPHLLKKKRTPTPKKSRK